MLVRIVVNYRYQWRAILQYTLGQVLLWLKAQHSYADYTNFRSF